MLDPGDLDGDRGQFVVLEPAEAGGGRGGTVEGQAAGTSMRVVGSVHGVDVVEPADQVAGAEGIAGPGGTPSQLLDHADVAPLVAPGLVHVVGVERHPGEPGAGLPVRAVADLVGPDEPIGAGLDASTVEEAIVRSEVVREFGRGEDG